MRAWFFYILLMHSFLTNAGTEQIEQRLNNLIQLYNHSKPLYYSQGPFEFWKTFALESDQNEFKILMESTRGLPDLPELKKTGPLSIEFSNESYLVKVKVIDTENSVFLINNQTLQMSSESELSELINLIVAIIENSHKPSAMREILEDLHLIPQSHAVIGKLLHAMGALIAKTLSLLNPKAKKHFNNRKNLQKGHYAGVSSAPVYEDYASPQASVIPSPTPEPSSNNNSSSSSSAEYSGKPGSLESTLSVPANLSTGKQCTIVFTRHGEKVIKSQEQPLTTYGHNQARVLAKTMSNFQQHYGEFDYVLNSNYPRSIQSAEYMKKANPSSQTASAEMRQQLRECTSNCSSKVTQLAATIKNLCKAKKPSNIFITSHGEIGRLLMNHLRGVKNTPHPDCARPFVLTSDDGAAFDLAYYKNPVSESDQLCRGKEQVPEKDIKQ